VTGNTPEARTREATRKQDRERRIAERAARRQTSGRRRVICWGCAGDPADAYVEALVERRDESHERQVVEICLLCLERPGTVWRRHWTLVKVRSHSTSPW
jgi:hypothetical protein